MILEHIPFDSITPSLWQGGKTFEYCIFPATSSYSEKNFDYRISSATIDIAPSEFTQFDGYTRYLIMLDNTLEIHQNKQHKEFKALEIFSFDSQDQITSFSKGSDFNLMIKKSKNNALVSLHKNSLKLTASKTILIALSNCSLTVANKPITLKAKDLLAIDKQDFTLELPETFIVIAFH